MDILFLSRWFPFPADNGAKIRIFNLIKHLSCNHDVTLISFTQGGGAAGSCIDGLTRYCSEVHAVPYREYRPTGLKALVGAFSYIPRSLYDTYDRAMCDTVSRVGSKRKFDVVIASQIDTIRYALLIDKVPRILEEIELSVIYDQFISQLRLLPKLRSGLTWWKTLRFISRISNEFAGMTAVSEKERTLVESAGIKCGFMGVVANGVDPDFYSGSYGDPQPNTLIYPGALTYFANADAMAYFAKDIYPLVREMKKDVRLRITGAYDAAHQDMLCLAPGIELTGYLDDIRPAVARSWLCVVPLRKGGGTRLKILEAMALGTPVVSTSKGSEGLDVTDGKDILIADDAPAFANAVLRLLHDKNLRTRLSRNGRELVARNYSWKIIADRLEGLLNIAVSRRSPVLAEH